MADHDSWMKTCFARSEGLLDVAPLCADSNPSMSLMERRTLRRVMADDSGVL